MKKAIRNIDRAIRRLYNLESEHEAENFLVTRVPESVNKEMRGALFVQAADQEEMSLGIFLSEPVRETLEDFPKWRRREWNMQQLKAFTVATEEISHFRYVIHHAVTGRQVSQLELELQGDIDKFILTLFARPQSFQSLFEQLFYEFRLSEKLSPEERDRYVEANRLARQFILKNKDKLLTPRSYEKAFRLLRRFYRLNASEKIGLIAA